MPGDIEKINEIFRIHDETVNSADKKSSEEPLKQPETKQPEEKTVREKVNRAVDKLLIDDNGSQTGNYTGDAETERDFRPVRQSRESRSGCLSGIMYFAFIMCISVILACVAWMAVSDALALNKSQFSAEVTLPTSVFEAETVDVYDEDGNISGSKRVTHADVDYISNELKSQGLIEYKWLFKAFCKLSHAAEKVDPGIYNLESTFDYRALIKNMQSGAGSNVTISVTFPEGFTMRQIFERLEEYDVCSSIDLMEAAQNYTYNYNFLSDSTPGDAGRLEGFLFPDTYEFYVGMQASSAINKFLETFYYKQTADMLKQAENRGMTMRQIVTIASLIEKEAANDDERALIASVIYNRLASVMPLGLESSILYVHPEHEGAPSADMLTESSPYNMLINTGLPPTPICNPGIASINAALNPASTNYYYFTLDVESGTHRFFTNINDFNAFVATQNYG